MNADMECDLVGSHRVERRESGTDCIGVVSRIQMFLIQHQTLESIFAFDGGLTVCCFKAVMQVDSSSILVCPSA